LSRDDAHAAADRTHPLDANGHAALDRALAHTLVLISQETATGPAGSVPRGPRLL
jgi:hypothetical protein